MDLQGIKYFVAIAEEGSFTEGARKSHIVQSAASAAVARLERELGVELFDRTGRRIAITEAGRVLLVHARVMLAEAKAARDDVDALGDGLRGVVTIGSILTTGTFNLPNALIGFRARHPGVRVSTRLSSAAIYDHFGNLLDGTFDLLIAPLPPHLPSEILMDSIGYAQIVPVCGLKHPLAASTQVRLVDLATYEQIDFPQGWGNRDLVDRAFGILDLERNVAIEVVDVDTALRLAAGNAQIAFVSDECLDIRADVVKVDLAEPLPRVHLGVAIASHRCDEATVRDLRAAILATVEQPLSGGDVTAS